MGGTQRLAAVAAVAHARHYYNHTSPDQQPIDSPPSSVTFFFASITLCGVFMMVCAACWHRKQSPDKPEEECRGVYTVSTDSRLSQVQMELPGPPPAYETLVQPRDHTKDCHVLQEVVTEPRSHCHAACLPARDNELPSYEAAVLLKDTKL